MLPGCHSALHVMVCEHGTDRLIAVSSRAQPSSPCQELPSQGRGADIEAAAV